MSAIEMLNEGTDWTDASTRLAMPILLSYAMQGDPITYGDLNKSVHARGGSLAIALTYRYVAGKIGNICEALAEDLGHDVPLLNAIIVNEATGLPSDGVDTYLAHYFGMTERAIDRLAQEERDDYARVAMEKVFNFARWLKIAKHLKLRPATLSNEDRGQPIPPPNPAGFAGGPETDAHKNLKLWLARNPRAVRTIANFSEGEPEKRLPSGDRVDVLFTNARTMLAAEVKTNEAPEDEVMRGVYQCIKYRATLRALQLATTKPPNAQAVLVMNCRPRWRNVRRLAELLSVTIIDVSELYDDAP